MKKIVSFLLICALCLSLFACKTEPQTAPTTEATTVPTSTTQPTTAPTEPTTASTEATEPSTTQQEEGSASPLLYRVSAENGGVLYLLGSIHAADERALELPDYVMDAYTESDFLAVECDVYGLLSDFEAQMELTSSMLLNDGTKVQDHISAETYALMQDYLEQEGLYFSLYDIYHPYFWLSLIESLVVEKSGLEADIGIDMQFLMKAYEESKEVREVESVAFQYGLLTSFSDELYDVLLRDTVINAELSATATADLYEAWLSGDEALLLTFLQDEFESGEDSVLYEEYNDAMITQRNITMAEVAEQYLSEGGTGFFVVGMAHIIGEGGCVDLLQNAGYTVEKVSP